MVSELSGYVQMWSADPLLALDNFDMALLTRPGLGDMNFEKLRRPLETIRTILRQIAALPDYSLSGEVAAEAKQHADAIIPLLERIGEFSIQSSSATANRDEIQREVLDERNWWVKEAAPWLLGAQVDITESSARAQLAHEQALRDQTEISQILAAAREAAGVTAARSMSTYFAEQEKRASESALRYLIFGAALFVVLMAIAIHFVETPLDVDSTSATAWIDLVRLAAPRLLVFGLIAYALRFAARSYAISRHEALASTQRKQSLDTFVLLTTSVEDAAARREVMTEMVRMVLGPYETGYLKGNESGRWDAFGLSSLLRRPE